MRKSSPLRGNYLVKNTFLYFFLKAVDFFSSFFSLRKNKQILKKPKKILLSNIAHLGDVVISTSAFSIIKKNFPDSKIGFICSSASKELIQNHHLIDKVYFFDHFKLNRSNISFLKKLIRYFVTKKRAIKEIRKEKYDVGIDLYYYFPNSAYLFWRAKIPVRIGYSSGGFKNFLTHKLDWMNLNRHVSLYHFDLIRFLKVDINEQKNLKFALPLFLSKNKKIDLPNEYIVFHIGAGDLKKKWGITKWIKLTKRILEKKEKIIFTGKGEDENNQINQIIKNQKNCINLCDKLDLLEIMEVIKKAKFVVCVDSLILHIATALNKPTVVIYCGMNNHHNWVLKKPNIIPILKKLDCAPCYMKNGCKTMDCLNKLEVEEVLCQMEKFFEKNI